MKIESILDYLFKLLIFIPLTILFVPAFLIVTNLQAYWVKKLNELFGF